MRAKVTVKKTKTRVTSSVPACEAPTSHLTATFSEPIVFTPCKNCEALAKELKTSRDYCAAFSIDHERLHAENAAIENQYHALKRDFEKRLQTETFAATRKLTADHEVVTGTLEAQLGWATDTLARHRAWEQRLRRGVKRGVAVTAAGLSLALGAYYGGPYVAQGCHAIAARIPAEHTATVQAVGSLLLTILCLALGWVLNERRQRRQRGATVTLKYPETGSLTTAYKTVTREGGL